MQSVVSIKSEDLQWICCIEKFKFFKITVVKELSLICIQTGEVKTWHVTPGLHPDVDFNDNITQEMYKVQAAKHQLQWHDGNTTETELLLDMQKILDENTPLFVTS
jgi:hypothetical protein